MTPRHAPYWQKVRESCHIGYRKLTAESTGTWIARYRDEEGKYQLCSLGALDAYAGHIRFDEAVKQLCIRDRVLPGVVVTESKGLGHLQLCLDHGAITWMLQQLALPACTNAEPATTQ